MGLLRLSRQGRIQKVVVVLAMGNTSRCNGPKSGNGNDLLVVGCPFCFGRNTEEIEAHHVSWKNQANPNTTKFFKCLDCNTCFHERDADDDRLSDELVDFEKDTVIQWI